MQEGRLGEERAHLLICVGNDEVTGRRVNGQGCHWAVVGRNRAVRLDRDKRAAAASRAGVATSPVTAQQRGASRLPARWERDPRPWLFKTKQNQARQRLFGLLPLGVLLAYLGALQAVDVDGPISASDSQPLAISTHCQLVRSFCCLCRKEANLRKSKRELLSPRHRHMAEAREGDLPCQPGLLRELSEQLFPALGNQPFR